MENLIHPDIVDYFSILSNYILLVKFAFYPHVSVDLMVCFHGVILTLYSHAFAFV